MEKELVNNKIAAIMNDSQEEKFIPSGSNENFNFYFAEIQHRFALTTFVGETSLERIERKLDELKKEVATKDDIIKQTNEIIECQGIKD